MALVLTPTQPAAGTRRGSSIEVVDTFTDNGQTKASIAIPIPMTAKVNDYIVAKLSLGAKGPGHGILSTTTVPAGALANPATVIDGAPSSDTIQTVLLTHVVKDKEPGTTIEYLFNCNVFVSWALTVRTCRYVDLNTPIERIATNASLGDTSGGTPTNAVGTTTPNALIVSTIGAEGGVAGLGVAPGPLPGWYDTVDSMGGSQPNVGQVSGLVDMPIPAVWQGASCLWNQGGANQAMDFAAMSVVLRPLQNPPPARYTLAPFGGSIDMAGASGIRPTVSWVYTPSGGSGPQTGWALARQETGTHANAGWWNATTNTWQSAQKINAGRIDEYIWPAGAWVNDGRSWDLYGCLEADPLGYLTGLVFIATFTADPPPAVTVTSPIGQTLATDPVTWAPALAAGYVETGWQVRIFSSDQYLADGFDPSGLLDDDTAYPSAAGGIGGWNADIGCTVAGGGVGITLTSTGAGNMAATSFGAQASHEGNLTALEGVGLFACKPGDKITTHQWFQAATTGRSCFAGVQFFKADGTFISAVQGTPITDSTTPAPASLATTAPDGAAFFILWPAVNGVANGERHFVQSFSAFPTAFDPRAFSGLVASSARTWTPPALRGGAYFRAYVRVMQTGAQLSPWAHGDWYANYANQAKPALSVASGADPVTGVPAAVATITAFDPFTLANTTKANLWRYDRKAQAYVAVRNGSGVPLFWRQLAALTNLLSADESDFEGGIGTWGHTVNCGVVQTTDQAKTGTHSLKMTATAGGTMSATTAQGTAGKPVVGLRGYVLDAWFRANLTARSVQVTIDWYDIAGTYLSSSLGPTVVDSTTGWTEATVSTQAPKAAAFADAAAIVVGAGAGEVHYLDAVVLAPTSQFVTIFDYEMPPNQEVEYQAQVYSTASSGP